VKSPCDPSLETLPAPPKVGDDNRRDLPRSGRRIPAWGEPALLVVAGLGACAYIAAIDPNSSSAYPQCPTKLLFGFDCPMCGATRAVHSLLRADLAGAIGHNLVFVIALPFMMYAFIAWTMTRMGRPMPPIPMSSKWLSVPLVIVLIAFTVVRNLPSGRFHWMNSASN